MYYSFQTFLKALETCVSHYKLDPADCVSAPSNAWYAMLFKTGIEGEQISDYKILDIFERQPRGGLCFVGSVKEN